LTIALNKHRYFSIIEQKTLTLIELNYGKVVQRITNPLTNFNELKLTKEDMQKKSWFIKTPEKYWDNISAHEFLFNTSIIITSIILIISLYFFAVFAWDIIFNALANILLKFLLKFLF
jgi:hypothetical protein